jgi:hypothetical protein
VNTAPGLLLPSAFLSARGVDAEEFLAHDQPRPWRSPRRLFLLPACTRDAPDTSMGTSLDVPAWAGDAIWYQIFVERFRNGDPSNDPTAHDIVGVTDERSPEGWRPTPWGHNWYRQEPWAKVIGKDFYATVQFRRYGGDLRGVLERLDYLQQLGVTALYLNPVNDAPAPRIGSCDSSSVTRPRTVPVGSWASSGAVQIAARSRLMPYRSSLMMRASFQKTDETKSASTSSGPGRLRPSRKKEKARP